MPHALGDLADPQFLVVNPGGSLDKLLLSLPSLPDETPSGLDPLDAVGYFHKTRN